MTAIPTLYHRFEYLLFGTAAGTFALYNAFGWLLPYAGLPAHASLALCAIIGLALGLDFARDA